MHEYHAQKADAVLLAMKSSKEGLRTEEAHKRIEQFGKNELPEQERVSQFVLFLHQFKSWFIYILIVAAVISFFHHKALDAYIIVAIILLNAIIGYIQESRAEHAIQALRSMIVLRANVLRNGEIDQLPAEEIVPGDVIYLKAGDRVPADARIIDSRDLGTQEASLTGESFTVEKNNRTLEPKAPLAERYNMVWMGTLVTSGQGTAVVVTTGEETALGTIATTIKTTEREKTHFVKKTNHLALQMGIVAIIASVITFAAGYFIRGYEFTEVFIFSVATLVSSIPEGLPAVLAVVLAIGANRMARKKAIVRHLPIIEDLSVTSVILTDKTGTLTQNTMTVRALITHDHEYGVSGEGWEPIGEFLKGSQKFEPSEDAVLNKMMQISSLTNSATLHKEEGQYEIIGDPTEASFVVVAEKAGYQKEKLSKELEVLDRLPFAQATRSQSVLVSKPKRELFIIGSEERILGQSDRVLTAKGEKKMTDEIRGAFKEKLHGLTRQAMRVVAVAYKEVPKTMDRLDPEKMDKLVFVGFMGIIDPIRPEAPLAIADARRAGIRVIMATGDHADTAEAIAREIGMFKGKDVEKVYTATDLEAMTEEEFEHAVSTATAFARMTPQMKMQIINTLQKQDKVVAMIGDGVNDAPGLKKANVGIAMGNIGTDVAREAADIILSDDNFATLMKAIEQGRLIFNNVRQTSFFMITTNLAEVLTIILSLVIGSVLPLTAIQILWINLITDGIPNVALAAEKQHEDLLDRPPRDRKDTIISKEVLPYMFIVVTLMVAVTLGMFVTYEQFGIERARTIAFSLMVFFQLFNALNMRSLEYSIFKIGLFSNHFLTGALLISFFVQLLIMLLPATQSAFGLTQLTLLEYVAVIMISASVLVCVELYKVWRRIKHHRIAHQH